jgi:hypothetical protein
VLLVARVAQAASLALRRLLLVPKRQRPLGVRRAGAYASMRQRRERFGRRFAALPVSSGQAVSRASSRRLENGGLAVRALAPHAGKAHRNRSFALRLAGARCSVHG